MPNFRGAGDRRTRVFREFAISLLSGARQRRLPTFAGVLAIGPGIRRFAPNGWPRLPGSGTAGARLRSETEKRWTKRNGTRAFPCMCFEDRYDPPHSPGQCRTVSPVNRPAARPGRIGLFRIVSYGFSGRHARCKPRKTVNRARRPRRAHRMPNMFARPDSRFFSGRTRAVSIDWIGAARSRFRVPRARVVLAFLLTGFHPGARFRKRLGRRCR